MRTNLRLASPDEPLRSFVVTSAFQGEGKSTVVFNLALAYAESGLRVSIIECDLRLPTLAKLMAIKPTPGLTEVLAGECELTDALQYVDVGTGAASRGLVAAKGERTAPSATPRSKITVLTAGTQPADPSSLLATERMGRLLLSARAASDVVILDTPPLLSVADALPLMGIVDATIVVARVGTTLSSAGRRVQEAIDRLPGASLLGVVANDVPATDALGGYYGYGAYGPSPDGS